MAFCVVLFLNYPDLLVFEGDIVKTSNVGHILQTCRQPLQRCRETTCWAQLSPLIQCHG